MRSIRLQTGLRNSSARLRLEPPELGRIRVDVRLAGDRLAIEIRTETEAATERLIDRVAMLKTALEHHGIHVDRFDVTTGPAEGVESSESSGRESGAEGDTRGSAAASGDDGGFSQGEADSLDTVPSDDGDGFAASDDVFTLTAAGEARLDVRA